MTKYALLFAGSVFEDPEIAPLKTIEDTIFWKKTLKEKHGYDENCISIFSGEDFTSAQLIMQIFNLALSVKKDDYVTIIISSHGYGEEIYGTYKQYIFTYDYWITENILYYLLRTFAPESKIALITDCCYTGKMLQRNDFVLDDDDMKSMKKILEKLPVHLATKIRGLFELCVSNKLPSYAWHLGSGYTNTTVGDGFFRQLNQALYKDLETKKLPMYDIENYRLILNKFVFQSAPNLYLEQLTVLEKIDTNKLVYEKMRTEKNMDLSNDEIKKTIISKDMGNNRLFLEGYIQSIIKSKHYDEKTNLRLELVMDKLGFYRLAMKKEYPQLTYIGLPIPDMKNTIVFEN